MSVAQRLPAFKERCKRAPVHIHIVAVSGTAMASLAGLLKQLGHTISGSDTSFDPPMGPALLSAGVQCMQGFDPLHLQPRPDLVVIGNVCRSDNPEAVAAREMGLPFTHVAGALQRFVLPDARSLVVAGTHGKTTTTSLCAWLLDACGLEPGFLVGGIPLNFGQSFRALPAQQKRLPLLNPNPPKANAQPRIFVIEGDEYDTAYFEKTPKFIHYKPEVAIITSIEHDHIDIYPTPESYLDAFSRFIELVPEKGLIVANASDRNVVELVQQHGKAPVAYFGLEDEPHFASPHWCASLGSVTPQSTQFDLFAGGVQAGRFVCPLPGRHNLRNALAAIAACAQGYQAKIANLGSALLQFKGVERRQQLLGTPRGAFLYDDFAHHPTAVKETLSALRARHPGSKLTAIFEARSATACRKLHQEAYAESFLGADEIVVAPLGRKLPSGESLDREQLVASLRTAGREAAAFESLDAIVAHLQATVINGDVVVLLSNGAFGGLRSRLLTALQMNTAVQMNTALSD
ncbi:MAG TPA: Mur ligase family protein [Polyangiaceae bacterium]|nr:Mur ligase family protein [Polyangiaceae bacterium]